MHILFLTDNFPPEVNAPASRTFEHCREWVQLGHRVTVITGAPNFPEGRLMAGYRNRLVHRETLEGIDVVRVWTYISANQGFFRRTLDYLSFALSSFVAGLGQTCDVIVATSPQLFTTLSACALSKVKRRPWVFELRDLWPASIAALGTVRSRRLLRLLERIELALYRDASLVVAVTGAFKANLASRGIDPGKVAVVTNGVDRDRFAPRDKDPELVRRHGLSGKTVVAYIGTHGASQGLGFIVDAAAALNGQRLHFLFVGAGADRQAVIERAKALKLTNTTFVETVPKDEVMRYIATADIMLIPLRKLDLFTTVIPSKIFEAAAMHRPILLGVDGEARQIVERFGAGSYYEPESQTSFLAALSEMATDADARAAMAAGCAALAASYDRAGLAAEMAGHLQAVVADHQRA